MLEYIGYNSIQKLKKILKNNNFKKIFLVTGRKSFEQDEIKHVILKLIDGYDYYHFNDFTPNPNILDVKKGLDIIHQENFDVIVAIGGGSVIDMAKSISLLSKNNELPEKIIKKEAKISNRGIPLIRIPTTAGSGSEATHFAVVYIGKTKYSLANKNFMKPDFVIVDPQFTLTLPKKITADTGMDALSQAIESFWNTNSTKESKNYSKKAIELIISNLVKSVNQPTRESRYNMAIAANYAGKAINITKTTACHAISYPITSYFNVPHGHAVALTLPSMIVFNSEVNQNDVLDPRGVKFVKSEMNKLISIIGVSDFQEAEEKIINIMKQINLETKLSELGISSSEDIDIIIRNGFTPNRVKNNPRLLTELQLRKILEGIK
ncbi:MAG: phosphonoacetaldehyde reductase [Promethearchaeota archaeon]